MEVHAADVISYLEMCQRVGVSLQRGMNFHLRPNVSVILMSLRPNAPYADRVEDEGRTLIYEGHDAPMQRNGPDPKSIDQPHRNTGGSLTQNGLFYEAAIAYKTGRARSERVDVYEKIRQGIWSFNGVFRLEDAWTETSSGRSVYKFKLALIRNHAFDDGILSVAELPNTRIIPSEVKQKVWIRDHGKCVVCGSKENLHFDHIIPFSRGGSSLVAENIQLLCAKHNLEKRDRIQ